MITEFANVKLILPDRILDGAYLYMRGGKILQVCTCPVPYPVKRRIDGNGFYLSPGFIDIHVHGGGGYEIASDEEAVAAVCNAHARYGTTGILPTTLASPIEELKATVQAVKNVFGHGKVKNILGVHLEGPYLSPAQSGAQKTENLVAPNPSEYIELLDVWPEGIRIMGAAPELDGALELGDFLSKRGCVASVAHSDATFEQVQTALAHGYSDITHLYSGCSTVRREKGYRIAGVVEAGLYFDNLTVQIIADGKHLPPSLLRLIYKVKGADRISLITDALAPAATPYQEGRMIQQSNGVEAVLEDGVMKLPNREAFAGSIATMNRMVRNMVRLAGAPLHDAVKMASLTPARIIGLDTAKGKLAEGYDADLIIFDDDIEVQRVFIAGEELVRKSHQEETTI